MDPTIITVDIYSDIACPWCYVGEHKFLQAQEQYRLSNPSHQIKIHWHPYMIDPATNKNGEDYLAYNKRRWGGDGWTYSLRQAGKKVGCSFSNWKIWPNTLLAHCLMNYAEDKTDQILNEIFELCYEKGSNVSNVEVLSEVAAKFGVDDGWKSVEIQKRVKEEDKRAKTEMNIHGVPYFVINGKYCLEGAVDPQTFLKTFKKI
eukprot:TRINITY_DN3501_c0_g1_i1.p1 TRINITY_DN3501_c0_g1~~TRINITY_DN3501_c0_g1_i1.p1  ORF type:complete len:203 (+),score=35.94 TRINITY_DN3501_c0_g1_i1:712-1320(+)